MIRERSRPGQALCRVGVAAGLVLIWRFPTIEREFEAALSAAAESLHVAVARQPGPTKPAAAAPVAVAYRLDARHPPIETLRRNAALAKPSMPDRVPNGSGPKVLDNFFVADTEVAYAQTAHSSQAPAATVDAGALATAAYARLAVGDRREAVRLFDAALAGADPRAALWRAQRNRLIRRWSATAYSIVRSGGAPELIPTPALGGGQSGGGIALTPDPLSSRPLAITLRGSAAHDDNGRTGFAAVGVQWRPLPQIIVAAERLIAVGPAARDDWAVRVAGGIDRTHGRRRLTVYGEGGVIGHAAYAAVQGRIAAIIPGRGFEIGPGAGLWSSVQRDRRLTVDRLDIGPGVAVNVGPLAVEVDYRFRVAGNAAPRSGPVLTISTAF